jgi:AcrR family transcriptional regulator
MRAIATEAQVSLPTVELLFGTKTQLLRAAIDVAIAGDDSTCSSFLIEIGPHGTPRADCR